VPPLSVNVTITLLPVLSVNQGSFSYNALPGQTPAVQALSITTNDAGNSAWTIAPIVTTPKLGTWLDVSTRAGSGSVDTVILLINTAGLNVGTYTGAIAVSAGPPQAPIMLPVTLVITSGAPNASLSSPFFTGGSNLDFAGISPPAENFTLINTGGNQFAWSLSATTASGGNWLLASPKSGNSATTITVAVDGVGLPAGTYTGLIQITIPSGVSPTLTVNVTYTISATTPIINSAGIVNAATFLPGPIAPGELIAIFGTNLANGAAAGVAAGNLLPTSIGITSVTIGGIAAPLIYASPTQINAQVPYEVTGQTAQVLVTLNSVLSQPAVVSVAAASPGVFSVDGTGLGTATVLRNSDFTLISAPNPARRGEVIDIFCTGLGQVAGGGVTGALASTAAATAATAAVTFGTTSAPVSYAGLAVGFAGLYQINVIVPSSVASGPVPVTIHMGTAASQALTTYIAAK